MTQTAAPPNSKTTTCPSCGSDEPWGFASWCPRCGYYPALKMNVNSPDLPQHSQGDPPGLLQSIPVWGYVLGGGVLAILAISLFGRLATEPDGPGRFLWALAQVAIGMMIVVVVQGVAYMHASSTTDRFGPFDIFMKPLEIWQPTFALLPTSASRVCVAVWGITAILGSVAIVNGIPWAALMDPGSPKNKKKFNLVQQIAELSGGGGGKKDQNLEEAMNDFAGKAAPKNVGGGDGGSDDDSDDDSSSEADAGGDGGGDGDGDGDGKDKDGAKKEDDEESKDEEAKKDDKDKDKDAKAEQDPAMQSDKVDCYIVGYSPEGKNDFGFLFLGAIVQRDTGTRQELKFVSSITAESLPASLRKELMPQLKARQRKTPVVKIAYEVNWVHPELMCQVKHQGWTRDKRLKQAEFLRMIQQPEVARAAPKKK